MQASHLGVPIFSKTSMFSLHLRDSNPNDSHICFGGGRKGHGHWPMNWDEHPSWLGLAVC